MNVIGGHNDKHYVGGSGISTAKRKKRFLTRYQHPNGGNEVGITAAVGDKNAHHTSTLAVANTYGSRQPQSQRAYIYIHIP